MVQRSETGCPLGICQGGFNGAQRVRFGGVTPPMSKRTKMVKFEMTLPDELDRAVMEWRRKQEDLPTRNEALRRLVAKGLESEKRKEE